MVSGDVTIWIPNPHRGDIGRELLTRILLQAHISREAWEKLSGRPPVDSRSTASPRASACSSRLHAAAPSRENPHLPHGTRLHGGPGNDHVR